MNNANYNNYFNNCNNNISNSNYNMNNANYNNNDAFVSLYLHVNEDSDSINKEINENENNNFLINIKFFNIEHSIHYPKKDLTGLLNLCFMKYISSFYDNQDILKKLKPEIQKIIINLQKNIDFVNDNKENICNLLKETKGNNILIYSKYLNMVINTKTINELINYLTEEKKNKIDIYWGCLSNYEEYSSFFEKELIKDLKNTKLDYSLISLGIIENRDEFEYKFKQDICPNMIKKILYHGSQIDPISKILTTEFKYAKRLFYGMGIYFSDIIDYITFYTGGNTFDNRRDNF